MNAKLAGIVGLIGLSCGQIIGHDDFCREMPNGTSLTGWLGYSEVKFTFHSLTEDDIAKVEIKHQSRDLYDGETVYLTDLGFPTDIETAQYISLVYMQGADTDNLRDDRIEVCFEGFDRVGYPR